VLDAGADKLQRYRVRAGIPAGGAKLIPGDAVPPILSHEKLDGGGGGDGAAERSTAGCPAGRTAVHGLASEMAEER
jgi:hypothetical protein